MAVATKGIDVRQALGDQIVFRAALKDNTGAKLITDNTTLSLYEIQDNGTLKTYDFADDTFKATAVTTETLAMTARKGNNNTTDLGVWSVALTTLTGFTVGAVYIAVVSNPSASPPQQEREFQFGGFEGDAPVNNAGQMGVDVLRVQNNTSIGANLVRVFATDFAVNYVNGSGWTGVALTVAEHTAIANAVETEIINEADSELVLQAIVDKINAMTDLDQLTLAAISSAVTTEMERNNGLLDIVRDRVLLSLPAFGPDLEGGLPILGDTDGNLTIPVNIQSILGNSQLATNVEGGVLYLQVADYKLRNYIQLITRNDASIANDLAAVVTDINADEGSGAGNWNPVGTVGNGSLQSLNAIANNIIAILQDTGGIDGVGLSAGALAAISALITADHGAGSYVRNTEPDNAGIAAIAVLSAAIKVVTDKLNTMLVNNAGEQFTEHALENAGGGGSGAAGPGASPTEFTITSNAVPLPDADVWITSDEEGQIVVAGTLQTNSEGKVTFLLDTGVTYYMFMQKNGENPIIAHEFIAD